MPNPNLPFNAIATHIHRNVCCSVVCVCVSFVENSVTEDKANVQNIQNILIHVWCMNGNSHKNMKYRYDFPSICVFEYIYTIGMQSKCRTFKCFWFWCLWSFYAATAAASHWIIKSNEILKYNALRKKSMRFLVGTLQPSRTRRKISTMKMV